jgi:flagellin
LIDAVDSALEVVNSSRATLGAVQNRFESVINNLQTSSESLSSARSRIEDADFAAETAALTKLQILQQAGTAMLSQANALPQGVMSLLR